MIYHNPDHVSIQLNTVSLSDRRMRLAASKGLDIRSRQWSSYWFEGFKVIIISGDRWWCDIVLHGYLSEQEQQQYTKGSRNTTYRKITLSIIHEPRLLTSWHYPSHLYVYWSWSKTDSYSTLSMSRTSKMSLHIWISYDSQWLYVPCWARRNFLVFIF